MKNKVDNGRKDKTHKNTKGKQRKPLTAMLDLGFCILYFESGRWCISWIWCFGSRILKVLHPVKVGQDFGF